MSSRKSVVTATYAASAFDLEALPHIAAWAGRQLRRLKAHAIAACGHSGLVLAGAIGLQEHLPVIAVRKSGEHSSNGFERHTMWLEAIPKRIVVLDDLISSGATIRWIVEALEKCALPKPVAILCYNSYHSKRKIIDDIPVFGTSGFTRATSQDHVSVHHWMAERRYDYDTDMVDAANERLSSLAFIQPS